MTSRQPRSLTRTYKAALWRKIGPRPANWNDPSQASVIQERDIPYYYEQIISDDGPSREVKFCRHIQMSKEVVVSSVTGTETATGYQFGAEDIVNFDPMPYINDLVLANYQPYAVDWDRVVAQFIPSFQNSFNLLNFAWEAGELRDLANSVREIITRPRRTIPRRLGVVPRVRDGRLTRGISVHEISNTYLEGVFGVAPLISDLRAIYRTVEGFGRRLGRVRAQLTRGITCKIQTPVNNTYTSPEFFVTSALYGSPIKARLYINYSGLECVSCRLTGSLPSDPVREYLDYIGFYPNLSTLWNAIPFSFLIDYIAPIGDALDSGPWLRPNMETKRGCYSLKLSGTWSLVRIPEPTPGIIYDPGQNQGTHLNYGTFKFYQREPVVVELDGIDLQPLHAPRLQQQLNIAALATSFTRRRN